MYVYIDRRKKFPATTLLRALDLPQMRNFKPLWFDWRSYSKKLRSKLYRKNYCQWMFFDMATGEIFLTKTVSFLKKIWRLKEAEVEKLKFISSLHHLFRLNSELCAKIHQAQKKKLYILSTANCVPERRWSGYSSSINR